MDVGLVCDDCRTFNAMGSHACTRCGVALALDVELEPIAAGVTLDGAPYEPFEPSVTDTPRDPVPAFADGTALTRPCGHCGHQVPTHNRFCGGCGSEMPEETRVRGLGPTGEPPLSPSGRISAAAPIATPAAAAKKTLFFGAMQAARAKLTVIKGDGLDGVSFTLAGADHQAGRFDVPILFEEDPYLSPVHANFFYAGGKLVVRDEGSLNGIFIRIRGAVSVGFGARFLIGEQILEIDRVRVEPGPGTPDRDGTYFYASPHPATGLRLVQRLRGGDVGRALHPAAGAVTLGREGNDLNFPDDPFISGRHARLALEGEALSLTDLGSKNGTFLRITTDTVLEHGDYVFMGQQLLRVEIV